MSNMQPRHHIAAVILAAGKGKRMNLKEGNKVIIEDDMIAPDKIRKHQKEVTGKGETSVTITEKTRVVVNDSTGRKAVYDTIRTVETK